MNERKCHDNWVEVEQLRSSWSELTRLMCTPNRGRVQQETCAPFLCMRLMCSQNLAEVESVKNELSKAGIIAETRNHPVAEALGVSGVELWVQDERDFFNAANLFAKLQNRNSGKAGTKAEPAPQAHRLHLAPELPQPQSAAVKLPTDNGKVFLPATQQPAGDLEETSSLLAREIEEMLQSEHELATECSSLRDKVKELGQTLAQSQASLTRETESRAAAHAKQEQVISELRATLDLERAEREQTQEQLQCQRAARKQAEEQLQREQEEWSQQLRSREESIEQMQKMLDSQSQLLETQQAAVRELKEQSTSFELRHQQDEESLSKACAQLLAEQEARAAAEQRAESAMAAQQALEQELVEQRRFQEKLQSHLASLNSLYSKVHAKRINRAQTPEAACA